MFYETQIATIRRTNETRGRDHSTYKKIAINCTSSVTPVDATQTLPTSGAQGMSDGVQALISNSLSDATRRAYRSDLAHYEAWGGTIPSAPEVVAEYLAELTETHTAATLSRRIASLAKAHRALGADDPTKAEIVRATMRGIRRMIGTAQREAKPLLKEDLFQMLAQMNESPKGRRDKALLLLGFAGAFRRSELVGLNVADIEHVRQGIVVTLWRSKTDQTGAGRKIGIPFGRTRWCPVRHLSEWLHHAGIGDGPIFRCINRHGQISAQPPNQGNQRPNRPHQAIGTRSWAMTRHKRPKFIHAYRDRHGKERVYFNRPGVRKIALPLPIYCEAFWTSYHKALAGEPQKPIVGATRTASGTMNALIVEYYQCAEFTGLAQNTRSTYRNQIEAFRKQHGEGPVNQIKTKHIDAILGLVAKKSTAQAHKLRKRLGTLFRLAVKWEYRDDNPMLNAGRIKHKTKGYAPWTETDILMFRAHWKPGTPQRIAFEILLYTGLRRSDAVRIGRQHIHGDRIVTKITKSQDQVEISIPLHPEFRAVLNTIEHHHLNFITTERGAARSEKAFTNWIIAAAKDAGLPPHRSPHGLRKSACIRLAEAGCTASEIMSITGHRNLAEVETYVRGANREKLSDSAIAKTYGAA